jgi:isopentenyl phosphate kinase
LPTGVRVDELVFLKLGGSLITDKLRLETPRQAVIERMGHEISAALAARPGLRLVVGHGSGSFGHFYADRFKVHQGHLSDWRGYAETAAAAQRLNRLVADALLSAGVPVVSLQPSASARCTAGELVDLNTAPVLTLLEQGLVPLVYGDVALDSAQGCTILSTEQILAYLARTLAPRRIIMAGEVAGVYSGDPHRHTVVRLVPSITALNYAEVQDMLSASFGVDVTGGMLSKVRDLFALVSEMPGLQVRIITGRTPQVVERVLVNPKAQEGTLLTY